MSSGRVLIVDDERFFRDLYRDVLEARGHAVRVASGASEATNALSKDRFDVVLTDLVMPGVDGFALVQELQLVDPEMETIVVTGKDDVRLAVKAMKAGCADFLTKPVDRDELLVVVERAMERSRLKREHTKLLSENMQFLKAQALYGQCLEILATLDLERLQDVALNVLARVTDAQGGALWVADDRGQLALRGYRGLVDRAALLTRIDPRRPPFGELVREGAPFSPPRDEKAAGEPPDAFYVPLLAQEEPVGLALLTDRASGRFGEEERATARAIADFAAIAVKNARRFQALERVGLRDRETAAYNLAYFVDYAGKEFYKARRYGRAFALVVLHVDNRDELRKKAGREVFERGMRALIAGLSKVARDADIVAKVTDNEFYLLLPETDYFGALMFLRRAQESVRREEAVKELEDRCPVVLTTGAASFPKDGEDFDELLHFCRQRIDEERGSLVRKLPLGHLRPQQFWEVVDLLLSELPLAPTSPSARLPADPDFFAAAQREAAREIARDPKARGILYVAARDKSGPGPLLGALESAEAASHVYLLGRRGDEAPSHPLVTPVFLDGDARLADHEFILYLSEHAAYGAFQRTSGAGRLFHTSDAPLVDDLVARLQGAYDLQPY